MTTLFVPELIARKRDGGQLSEHEISALISAYAHGQVPDYQMAAWAMAVFFRGMTPGETVALTLAMRDSGHVLDLSALPGPKVDKHSTGGVGDKVSLCLAPIAVACGLCVPMISGRGLGHTGGTLDKLEAVPGFRVDLDLERAKAQLGSLACALIGQTAELAPADKALYALRDVTATVESIPLITASILSKKLAEGIDALVLDVKVGRGAFMKDLESARALAHSLVEVGSLAGKRVSALLTAMDAPLGCAIGNALETAEAMEVLRGEGPTDLVECTRLLVAEMLILGGLAQNEADAQVRIDAAIGSGEAASVMRKIVSAQGGDPSVVDAPDCLPKATTLQPIEAADEGYIADIDALVLGRLAVEMGAGRSRVDDAVDPAVGIVVHKKPGDRIERGEALATLHLNASEGRERFATRATKAFTLATSPKPTSALLLERVRSR